MDRVEGGKTVEASLCSDPSGVIELDNSGNDGAPQGTEEWEGAIAWGSEKKTVSQSLNKIDLASLTDWNDQ